MHGYPWGGSEELWSLAALRLKAAGHFVAATTEDVPPVPQKLRDLVEKDIPVRVRKAPPGALGRALWSRLTGHTVRDPHKEWVVRQRPDLVVISQGGNTDGWHWMKFCREQALPFMAVSHCNTETAWPADRDVDEIAAAYRSARVVGCVSRHNLRLLEWQLGGKLPNARVIWNPNLAAALELLPWPAESEKTRLACVGRLDPVAKGQDVLLQALALPQWRARPVELNLYGTGPAEKTLRAMARRLSLDNVNFCGYASVAEIWRDNHLLAMPSRQEGLPLTLVEAMSCGRPAVVTDVGGNAEMCVEGEMGFIASAAAVTPMAEALERAWTRRADWPQMGRAGRQRIMELVPRDPVGDFCEILTSMGSREAQAH